jgi:hypothetical protein
VTFCDSCRRRNGKYRYESGSEVFWLCFECLPLIASEESRLLDAVKKL